MSEAAQVQHGIPLERFRTGVPGLDDVLAGGLVRGGIYLIFGRPGTGKTTLGNQIAHQHARAGGTVLFLTALAESHGRMVSHLRGFDFFGPELVARGVQYLSLYDRLREDGLSGVLDQVRRLVLEHRASLVVIDGAALFNQTGASNVEHTLFTVDLHTQLAGLGATSILLSDETSSDNNPIATHVDGIITLRDEAADLRNVRLISVIKLRGVGFLRGSHQFEITGQGFEVYPRLEGRAARGVPTGTERRDRLAFGIGGFDDMLRGGVLSGSTTLLMGAPGAGKTITGLHFIAAGAAAGETGLIATFHETPARLIGKAEAAGLDLARHVSDGLVRILWRPPTEVLIDAWGHELLGAVAGQGTRRLFVDAVTDLQRLAVFPRRMPAYLAALTNELRGRDVTTVFSAEADHLISASIEIPISSVSATMVNLILLRYVELRSQLRRLISVVKVRESDYDSSLREFSISERGMQVADTFVSAEAILSGMPRLVPAAGLIHPERPISPSDVTP